MVTALSVSIRKSEVETIRVIEGSLNLLLGFNSTLILKKSDTNRPSFMMTNSSNVELPESGHP